MNITTGAYTQLDDAAVSHTDDYEAVGLVEVSQKEKKKEEEVEEGEKKNRKETGLEEKEGEVLEEVKET